MEIQRFGPISVDEIYTFVNGKPRMLKGLTRSYIWENTRPRYFIGIYYTKAKTNREFFSNIFYQYGLKEGNVIEEWYSNNVNRLQAILKIASLFDSPLYFNLEKMDIGNELGWNYVNKRLEMTFETSKSRDLSNDASDLKSQHAEQVAELFAQEWWTNEQAKQFVDVAMSNPNSISKVIICGKKVCAFGHATYDKKQAWINAIYVDLSSREKGFGRRITESLLSELQRIGMEKVNLGVGEDNTAAIKTYQSIGFSFTSFVRYRFEVPFSST